MSPRKPLRPRSRIKHRLSFPELAVRLLLIVSALAGLAYVGRHAQVAIATRFRQMELVSAATKSADVDRHDVTEYVQLPSGPNAPRSSPSSRQRDELNKTPNRQSREAATVHPLPAGQDAAPEAELQVAPDASLIDSMEEGAFETVPETPRWFAPDVTLVRYTDGTPLAIRDDQSRQIRILDFWASWCGPCLQELPVVASLVSEYPANQIQLIAVNTEEDAAAIRRFLDKNPIAAEVALDERGEAAAAFGVEQLPTLVIIDSDDVVQRIHVGFTPGLQKTLRRELDSLLAGKTLSPDPNIAAHLHDSRMDPMSDALEANSWQEMAARHHGIQDLPLELSTGRMIPVGTAFREAKEAFDEFLQDTLARDDDRVSRINHANSQQTSLIIGRRGKELHGPLVSFYEDGTLRAYVQYRYGKRIASLLTWDPAGRPLVMEQYDAGLRNGLRSLFKSCSENCQTGHVWMVQEWRRGDLLAAHTVLPDGTVATFDYQSSRRIEPDSEGNAEFALATKELNDFASRLDSDEEKLRKMVVEYYVNLRRAIAAQAKTRFASTQTSYRSIPAAFYPANVRLPYGFRPQFGASMGGSRIRNCGRS